MDLLSLGLTVSQELSPHFSVNGLPYQVVAHYSGTGTETHGLRNSSTGGYAYFSPETVWGPLGAGWSVHMGKVLSSGGVTVLQDEPFVLSEITQWGFDEDGGPCTSTEMPRRRLFNTIVEPSGVRHPMQTGLDACAWDGNCEWPPTFSIDYSWIRADLIGESQTVPPCHGVKSWRTPDGTRYDVNNDGLVTRITDLSGNWVGIEYYDTLAEFPCDDASEPNCPSYRNYGVSLSKLPHWRNKGVNMLLRDPGWPLKEITDSFGRRIQFTLSDEPIGGKYRIVKITSESPAVGGVAEYLLQYETRNVINFQEATGIEGLGGLGPCTGGPYSSFVRCLAPEMSPDGHSIPNVAFLVQVTRPDGATIEYDYHPWGDLKSIRTANGGLIEYGWRRDLPANGELSNGVRLAYREVRPAPGSNEAYRWTFRKNVLPDFDKLVVSVSYKDLDRTIMTTPEGAEIAYRFNDYGQLRNVKVYAGTAFRYEQTNSCGGESCIDAWPTGRLMREINWRFNQGKLGSNIAYLIRTNEVGVHERNEAVRSLQPDVAVNTRAVEEVVLYLDDPIVSKDCSYSRKKLHETITGDVWWDLRGDEVNKCDSSGPAVIPRAYYPYSREVRYGWTEWNGYRNQMIDGSAVGFVRTEEQQFPYPSWSSSPNEPTVCNLSGTDCGPAQMKLWFRSPIPWKKIAGTANGVVIGNALFEYQYDPTHFDKVSRKVARKTPASIAPRDQPYEEIQGVGNGDLSLQYEYFNKREETSPPGAPHGLARRVMKSGGDAGTDFGGVRPATSGTYEETLDYLFGVATSRQVTGVSWKSVDVPATEISRTGHARVTRDPSGISTRYEYDMMGQPRKSVPEPTSGEYAEHVTILYEDRAAEGSFRAGRKIIGRVVWKGPAAASWEADQASSSVSYTRMDLDGFGRTVREERKLQDGARVERLYSYCDVEPCETPQTWYGWDRVKSVTEWVCATSSAACPRPSTLPRTVKEYRLVSTDPNLSGRIDPFLRVWRETAADGARRVLEHFGLNTRVTTEHVKGRGDTEWLNPKTVYYRDHFGRLRLVDVSPTAEDTTTARTGADAIYDYDLFGNLSKATLVDQLVNRTPNFPPIRKLIFPPLEG